MISNLIEFSIKNKLVIGLLTLAMIGAGVWSMFQVPIDAEPDITNNQVQIITQAPNLGTEDIEQFVTYPVELTMANLPGVNEIRSVSRFGLSVVTIVFDDEMGTYLPRQLVAEKLNHVKDDIPEGFGEPEMGPISTGLGEIYQYTLEVDKAHKGDYSITDLRTMQDWIVKRQMAMIPGVVEINGFGGKIKQYEVAVSPDELRAIDITIEEVYEALTLNNQNTGGAYIEKDHRANFIRGEGLAKNIADLEDIVIKSVNGLPIRIKDVATVSFGANIRYGAFTKDGQGEAVGGMVLMLKGANAGEVIALVQERVLEIEKSLPEGVSIEPFLDRSEFVSDVTSTIAENLIEGGLIVIFVLVIFLGNWRGGLIVASTIPLSLLFAFILMNAFGVWVNLMSLGAIDFGIIVDGAVIIVESVVFMLHSEINKRNINANVRDEIAMSSSKNMMNSAFFGQLIILIVFLPILALQGVEGKMFKPMALTFSFAIIGAMVLCLTYVPMMSSFFIRAKATEKQSWGDKVVKWLEKKYHHALIAVLNKFKWIAGVSIVFMAVAVFLFSRLGGEFIPQLDEGDVAFHVILKPGSSLSESLQASTQVEQILLENFPEIEHAMTRFGVADVPTDPMPMDIGDCFVILKPREEWTTTDNKEELIDLMKEKISMVAGLSFEFTQPIEMRFNELLTGVREDVAIKLFGDDLQVLSSKAQQIGSIVSGIDGVADMRVEATSGLPQITVNYQRDKLAQYGLNISDVNSLIQTAFAGSKAGVIFEGERRFDVVLRLNNSNRGNIRDLKQLYVTTKNGAQIPLNEIAEISYKSGPMQISRDNTSRRVNVGINVRGRDVESLVREIQQKLKNELQLPPGYYVRYGGAFENLERASKRLKVVVPIALGLIFILIFFALKSFTQTLMIYMAIPLAAVGGVVSLWLRGMPFSISAGVGFIVLFGVAVLNGLVLINGFNELKEEGEENVDRRVIEGSVRRIRPILLTALTDILGFLPMAISSSSGAEVQRPLATVVIGGLATSTMLTLFVLPVLYKKVELRSGGLKLGKAAVVVLLLVIFSGNALYAQQIQQLPVISLEEAQQKCLANYPSKRISELNIHRQEQLKKTAWDLGRTQVYTGGEELKDGAGVKTIVGLQQQQIDVFGVAAKKKLQLEKVTLAEEELQLTKLELLQQLELAYAHLVGRGRTYEIYIQLDSIYGRFEKAAKIRFDTEETSKLEWLTAQNQYKKLQINKNEAAADLQMALIQFNKWLVSDTIYNVDFNNVNPALLINVEGMGIENHPIISIKEQEAAVADKEVNVAKAQFLPKLNGQFAWQKVNDVSGYRSFQVGVNIPLFFSKDVGELQAAKINSLMNTAEVEQWQIQLGAELELKKKEYFKYFNAWQYYDENALEVARQQQNGALQAYNSGELDYLSFVQIINDAFETEFEAADALQDALVAKYQLLFFLTPLDSKDN